MKKMADAQIQQIMILWTIPHKSMTSLRVGALKNNVDNIKKFEAKAFQS